MRVTTLFRKFIDIKELFVERVEFEGKVSFVHVKPRWRVPRCGCCGKKRPGYDRRKPRRWRHLSLGSISVVLVYAPWRVDCPDCGIRTEKVPWAPPGKGRFTWDFEEMAAYLAQITDKTTVTQLMGICWETLGSIIERVIERTLDGSRLDNLKYIGVDEFSYRKRHHYLTNVVDHSTQRVIWSADGKASEVLAKFFDELGEERKQNIEVVTMDMAGSYEKAVKDAVPHAQITYDRFHVQQLVSKALEEVRRELVNMAENPKEAKAIKGTRFVILKKPENLTRKEKAKLSDIQKANKKLYRAYLLKESLGDILNYRQPKRARDGLDEWLSWASRSKLKPFVRAARTIRQRIDGVIAYIDSRLTNGLIEGIHNKLRVVARRAYGFHSPGALISMLFLTCGGVELNPPLPETNPLFL